MKTKSWLDALLDEVPHYDEVIMKDIKPSEFWLKPKPWLDALPIDVRWLPNKLRPLWSFQIHHPKARTWKIAKRFRLKRQTVEDRLEIAGWIIDEAVRKWLKSLPLLERRRQRYARQKSWRKERHNFFARVPIGSMPVECDAPDRFRDVWPNVKSNWPKTTSGCTGEPCDVGKVVIPSKRA